MKATIFPSTCKGTLKIPPSKSMSHRAIIAASLANGKSTISNIAFSEDILTTIEGMKNLGATITCFNDAIEVEGIKDFKHLKKTVVFCKESGSTLRFFIPIFSLCNQTIAFTGENRLLKRPQKIYETIFKSQNIAYIQDDEKIEIGGSLKSGNYELDGNVSSQFISGLLFALPLLDGDSTIHIKEPYESRSYVDLTLEILELFGIEATYLDANTLFIKGGQSYKAKDYRVEGDFSQSGFFAVLASINHDLTLSGLNPQSKQGDKQIIDIIKSFGIKVKENSDGYSIQKGVLIPSKIDLQDCPDLGPILTVLMAYTKGTSQIYNATRLRYKESDRILAMETELKKCGVEIQSTEGEIIVVGNPPYTCNVALSGHKDHRIVMSLAIAATLFKQPVTIHEAQFINKSYPTFFEDLSSIGIKVHYE